MHRQAGIIFLLLFINFSSHSQQNKSGSGYVRLYRYAEKLYNSPAASETTDSIAWQTYMQVAVLLIREKKYNDTLEDSYLKCGILEMARNEQERALGYFHQAIFITRLNTQLPDSLLFRPYLFAGSIHYNLNNLDSAVNYYKKAEAVYDRHPGISEPERLFNRFGALYFETGDYNQSISYFEKALSLVEKKTPVNSFFVVNYKNNIATALMKLGRYNQALNIFRELLQYGNPADEILFNIGNTYFEKENYPEALQYIRLIRHMDFEKFNSLVKIFIRQQQYDSARIYISRAKQVYSRHQDFNSKITYGIVMKYTGDLKAATGHPGDALTDYQQAILFLDPSFRDTAIAANPVSFTGLQNFLFLFDALVAKAGALNMLYKQHPDTHFLEQSLDAYSSALSLSNHIEKTYFSDVARLFLKNKVNPATQDAVEVAILLYNLTKRKQYINSAFGFVENNKATVLQAGLKNIELYSIPGLPAGLVSEEKKYRTLIAKLTIQSEQLKDSQSFAVLQRKIHDLEVSLASVQDKLDENPVYHKLKFGSSTVNMDSLQEGLQGEAILSYYYTADNLVCFYITKENAGFTSIPLHENLFSTIISLRKELQSPEASSRKYLKNAGSILYRELVEPIFDKIKDKKRLIIIPYNEISYLPFEMLVTPEDGSLLLKKFPISYNYAASFLADKNKRKEMAYDVLAMAPFSGVENASLVLPVLPASGDEIKNLPGKKLAGAEATKMQFTELAHSFPVIHLATHAVANDTNLLGSYIEFYGLKNEPDTLHRLFEQEIYTLDMKSVRLVILSACETGNGLLVNGEGIMSLSRAFSYAGCKSVVTSLWKADEFSTSFISRRLHNYLQSGLDIDVSLQKSKLDYLESSEIDERFKNPAYWAHLVLIGDYRPVIEQGIGWYLWGSVVVTLVLLTLLYITRRPGKS
jgi:CHAT domain-containing protein